MVLILNIKSSNTLKKWRGKQEALHSVPSFIVGISFYKYWNKKTKEKKKPLIYKTDCSLIDFLLNIDERAILSNSWMRDFAPVDKKKPEIWCLNNTERTTRIKEVKLMRRLTPRGKRWTTSNVTSAECYIYLQQLCRAVFLSGHHPRPPWGITITPGLTWTKGPKLQHSEVLLHKWLPLTRVNESPE